MKKLFFIIIIIFILNNNSFLLATEKTPLTKVDYENFITLLDSIYKNGFDNPDRKIYPEILNKYYNFIELYPESPWTIAAFFKMTQLYNRFSFDRDTTYDDMLKHVKNFNFKNEYSKFIFYATLVLITNGSGAENNPDEILLKLYNDCSTNFYKPYLNYLMRVYLNNAIESSIKEKIIDEILNNEIYKQTLFYPNTLLYKISNLFQEKQYQAALTILIEMTSESFYKDKVWKESYLIKNGLFEDAFLSIIGAYVKLNNLEKAKAYLQIAEKRFKHNYDLKYYIEEVSLLESKKAR